MKPKYTPGENQVAPISNASQQLEDAPVPVKILIGGDLCPIGRNQPLLQQGNGQALLNDLLLEFQRADLVVANLECPLIDQVTPADKVGPVLGAPRSCIKGLQAMGIDVVTLANNHIMDHGEPGLRATIDALNEGHIDHVGAGMNLDAAGKLLVRQVKGMRIAVLALAEHEFGMAGDDTPGANPLDIINAVRTLRDESQTFDGLIIFLHAGNELYPYPRPDLMKTCRFLVEQGACAVVCQHSHCAGCMETYQGATIVYGQGNFLFDKPGETAQWNEATLVLLTFDQSRTPRVELIPYRQSDTQAGARKMGSQEENIFRRNFLARSEEILDQTCVNSQWHRFCQNQKRYYMHALHGKPGLIRRVLAKLNRLHYLDSNEIQRKRLNLIRCESHREILLTLLSIEADR